MFFLCNLILLKLNVNKFLKINYVSVQNAKKFYVTLVYYFYTVQNNTYYYKINIEQCIFCYCFVIITQSTFCDKKLQNITQNTKEKYC